MERKALLLTGLIILISGCTGGGTGGGISTSAGSYGVVIDEFSADIAVIDEGDITTMLVSFTNVDDNDATNIFSRIYTAGLRDTGDPLNKSVSDLESKNSDFYIVNLQAPSDMGVDRKYRPYADLCYNYENSGSTSAFVIDRTEYNPQDPKPELSSHTDRAPVQLHLSITQEPIKVADDGSMPKELTIVLTNVDEGNVYTGTKLKEGKMDKFPAGGLNITIPKTIYAGINVLEDSKWDCGGTTKATNTTSVTCTNKENISFGRSGEGNSISMDLNFTIDSKQEDTVFFVADAKYRYCIETNAILITAKAMG